MANKNKTSTNEDLKGAAKRAAYYYDHPDDIGAKEDSHKWIRKAYYTNHPQDKDAKNDTEGFVRRVYYTNHPQDKDAKYDKDAENRKIYYQAYPQDKDAKKDEDESVRRVYYTHYPFDQDAKKEGYKTKLIYYSNNVLDWDGIENNNGYASDRQLNTIGNICLTNKTFVENIIKRKINHRSELTEKEKQLIEIQKN